MWLSPSSLRLCDPGLINRLTSTCQRLTRSTTPGFAAAHSDPSNLKMNCLLQKPVSVNKGRASSGARASRKPAVLVSAVQDPAQARPSNGASRLSTALQSTDAFTPDMSVQRPGGRSGASRVSTSLQSMDKFIPNLDGQRPGGRSGRGLLPNGASNTSPVPSVALRPSGGASRGGPGNNGGAGGDGGRSDPGGSPNGRPMYYLMIAGVVGSAVAYQQVQGQGGRKA